MNIYGNIITDYNEMIYKSRPVRFDEFITDKYNKIHIELFNDALCKYFKSITDDVIDFNFMYEFFNLMSDTNNDFEIFYEKIESLDSEHIFNKVISKLSIRKREYSYNLYNAVSICLNSIKEKIIDNNILTNVYELSDIEDFRIVYYDQSIYLGAENNDEEYDEYITYKITYNSDTNKYELIKENLIKSEIDDYLIIFENDKGNKIGYNRFGEFIIILNNEDWEFSYNSEDKKIFLDKYLFRKSATLMDQFKTITESQYKNDHKIIELKNEEYWEPSSIIIISNKYPYVKQTIDLTKYWNYIQSKNNKSIYDIMITKENINDIEICDLNYVNGNAKLISRSNNLEYEVPFEYLNKDIKINEDMILDENQSIVQQYNNT